MREKETPEKINNPGIIKPVQVIDTTAELTMVKDVVSGVSTE